MIDRLVLASFFVSEGHKGPLVSMVMEDGRTIAAEYHDRNWHIPEARSAAVAYKRQEITDRVVWNMIEATDELRAACRQQHLATTK